MSKLTKQYRKGSDEAQHELDDFQKEQVPAELSDTEATTESQAIVRARNAKTGHPGFEPNPPLDTGNTIP